MNTTTGMPAVNRVLIFLYGIVSYLLFFAAILWAMGFVGNILVPRSIDAGGVRSSTLEAILIDSALLAIFAIQHTIMARKGFKRWVTQFIPAAAERSTFVLVASVILLVTFWQWRPLPETVWQVDNAAATWTLDGLYWIGWGIVFFSSFLINHFDLFGLRQVTMALRNSEYKPVVFKTTILYRFVRHPLLLGFVIAFWSAPVMSEGRLLFAFLTTAYILVGIQFEERDLAAEHGEAYRQYRQNVPMLIPHKGLVNDAGHSEARPRVAAAKSA